jgi:hypothetical protein
MDKEEMKAQEVLTAKLEAIAGNPMSEESQKEFAYLANTPYDAEQPIPEVIAKTCKVERLAKGDRYWYYAIGPTTKTVYTVSNGGVTQVNVTPDSQTELTLASYTTPEEYVYLEELLTAAYDVIGNKTKDAMEAMNRKEIKDVLDVMIASAVARSQTFVNDSGDTALDFPKLEEMTRSLELYGTDFILITGSTVSADVRLMNYNANKFQSVKLSDLGINEWIKMPAFQYTHSGTQTVMASDKAILVVSSDVANERPVHFVRRMTTDISGTGDKERVIVNLGPRTQVGSTPKVALSVVAFEQYGVVQPNPYGTAVYQRASSYS